MRTARTALAPALALAFGLATAAPALAIEAFDGRLQIHGAMSQQFRAVGDGYRVRHSNWFLSAMRTKLSVEIEADLLPDGWGPIDILEGFVRLDVQYDCVFEHACHAFPQWNYFGDDVRRQPENLANGRSRGVTGVLPDPFDPVVREQPDRRLLNLGQIEPFETLLGLGSPEIIDEFFADLFAAKVTTKHAKGSLSPLTLQLGPLNPGFFIDSTGLLADKGSVTPALPLRPAVDSLFIPSAGLRDAMEDFDNPDVDFTENELAWNLGASQQQTKWLREAYLDVTMLEGRLQLRLGRQISRWGKTELLRSGSPDQLNPQDLAIGNLASFEESLIPLWQARAIYSFYRVGPFEDLRLELAVNLDHFEPADLGDCGEPYTVFLVCQKQLGLLAHGFSALGLSGEERPPNWFDDVGEGLEFGARVEFRLGRLAVAISDFYGYNDFPTPDFYADFERNVDPLSGRPRIVGSTGIGSCASPSDTPLDQLDPDCLAPGNALALQSGNRQLFDVFCAATVGIELPGLPGDVCAISLFNSTVDFGAFITIPRIVALALGGGPAWTAFIPFVCIFQLMQPADCLPPTTELHAGSGLGANPGDDFLGAGPIEVVVPPGSTFFTAPGTYTTNPNDEWVSGGLSVEQEALLGCGPYYYGPDDGLQFAVDTDVPFGAAGIAPATPGSLANYNGSCSRIGIDLFQAEASALFQRFPQIEGGGIPSNGVVATRFLPGVGLVQLPGARSPFTFLEDRRRVGARFAYNPLVDGCVVDLNAELPDVAAALNAATPGLGDICNGTTIEVPLDGGGTRVLSADEIRLRFPNETAIVSENFLKVLIAFSKIAGTEKTGPGCGYGPADGLGITDLILQCEFVPAIFEASAVQRPERRAGGNGRYGRRDFTWLAGSPAKLFYERRNVFSTSVDFTEDFTKTSWGIDFTWIEDQPYQNTRADRGFSLEDNLNLVVSVDRPTFVNFLNANRTIFFNAQFFMSYIPNYQRRDTFLVDGPFSLLATLTAFTGFYQDRLMTFMTLVHEVESNSGGQIMALTYRYSESFSVSVGLSAFYGEPSRQRVHPRSPATRFHAFDFTQRTNFRGVSAISERDEIFVSIRKTF